MRAATMQRLCVTLFALLSVTAAGCGGSTSSPGNAQVSVPHNIRATLTVWLGGNGPAALPGTPFGAWYQGEVKAFVKEYPHVTVQTRRLATTGSDQLAQLRASFAANQVPDVLLNYAGGPVFDFGSRVINLRGKYVTPSVYNQFTGWSLGCQNFCSSSTDAIYGVPNDTGGWGLFYNKSIFRKVGVSAPFATWADMIGAAHKLKAAGYIPFALGNLNGYEGDAWVGDMYRSYVQPSDITGVLTGKVSWTNPVFVKPLQLWSEIYKQGLTNPDAGTTAQVVANPWFASGKAAMNVMYGPAIPALEKALGHNLGIMKIPSSANGPMASGWASLPSQYWSIPTGASDPALSWAFIKQITSAASQTRDLALASNVPTNLAADISVVTDPIARYYVTIIREKPDTLLVDNGLSANAQLAWFTQLGLAFLGKESAQSAMGAVAAAAEKYPATTG